MWPRLSTVYQPLIPADGTCAALRASFTEVNEAFIEYYIKAPLPTRLREAK